GGVGTTRSRLHHRTVTPVCRSTRFITRISPFRHSRASQNATGNVISAMSRLASAPRAPENPMKSILLLLLAPAECYRYASGMEGLHCLRIFLPMQLHDITNIDQTK